MLALVAVVDVFSVSFNANFFVCSNLSDDSWILNFISVSNSEALLISLDLAPLVFRIWYSSTANFFRVVRAELFVVLAFRKLYSNHS